MKFAWLPQDGTPGCDFVAATITACNPPAALDDAE